MDTILIVEDDASQVRFLEGLLRKRLQIAQTILVARSLAEAAGVTASTAPELVLLDLSLPDSDGMETLRAVQGLVGDVPIVILSGYNDEDLAKQALCLGAQEYLVKAGIDSARIGRAIENAVARHGLARERLELEAKETMSRHLEAVGQLAAGIAHEINTPIQYVMDNCHFFEESLSDILALLEELSTCADGIDGRRLAELLDEADAVYVRQELPRAIAQSLEGLRSIARIVQAMREFSHPPVEEAALFDLNRAVETSVLVAASQWRSVADVEQNLDPALPEVEGFPGDINQALLNLLVNAAHAIAERRQADPSDARGRITISTRLRDDMAELTIEDTGTGMSPDVLERLFEPFFTTKEIGKGTGQGLPLVHNVVVKKHGGSIEVESQLGTGSTFRVRLPLSRPSVEMA